jgi:hypothetical protein
MDAFNDLPEEVKKYAETHGFTSDSEKLNILLSTSFDENMTEKAIAQTLALSQKIADNNDIFAKVKLIPELADQLKDDMTYEDW